MFLSQGETSLTGASVSAFPGHEPWTSGEDGCLLQGVTSASEIVRITARWPEHLTSHYEACQLSKHAILCEWWTSKFVTGSRVNHFKREVL